VHSQRVLLALTQAGLSREDSYLAVQRNAMKVWGLPEAEREGAFLSFLQSDEEVSAKISAEDLAASFDMGYHTKHVDTIFARVFGSA